MERVVRKRNRSSLAIGIPNILRYVQGEVQLTIDLKNSIHAIISGI